MALNEGYEDLPGDPLAEIEGPYSELRSHLYEKGYLVLPHPTLGFGDPQYEDRLTDEAQKLLPICNIAYSDEGIRMGTGAEELSDSSKWMTAQVNSRVLEILKYGSLQEGETWTEFTQRALGIKKSQEDHLVKQTPTNTNHETPAMGGADTLLRNVEIVTDFLESIDEIEDNSEADLRWHINHLIDMKEDAQLATLMPHDDVLWDLYIEKSMICTLNLIHRQMKEQDPQTLKQAEVSKLQEFRTVRSHFERLAVSLGFELKYPKMETVLGGVRDEGSVGDVLKRVKTTSAAA